MASPAAADPIRDAQWHLGFLNVAEAHRHSEGAGVIVGVIDTGVDAAHPDLAGSVLPGRDFTTEATDDAWADFDGHGTAMAGLIAAHGRALGIAPRATILPVRDTVYELGATSADKGITWAVEHGATVLCLAFGQDDINVLRRSVELALASDVVVVAGVGNEPQIPGYIYPAAYPGVIGAAGVDKSGDHADVSVVGPHAALSAPAVDITSTDTRIGDGTGYRRGTGTSDATAIIAGAAALVRAKFPELSAAEVVHRLTATADDRGPPGRDDQYGYGIVNLVKALTAEVPPLQPSPTASANGGGTAAPPPAGRGGIPARTVVVIGALTLAALIAAASVVAVRSRRP